MPDGNKSSASRLSLSAMLPQATCSQPSRRGLQQASSARHSAVGVPGMDALGGRMDTLLQVVNARPDAQSRCRRAARSRAELVVVWCTCREQKGMPEHTVSERLPSQLSAWAHQLLRNMCRRDDQACAVQGSWRCTWARPPHLESRHPAVRPTTRELRELKGCPRSLLRYSYLQHLTTPGWGGVLWVSSFFLARNNNKGDHTETRCSPAPPAAALHGQGRS